MLAMNKFTIIAWNVRGLNDLGRRKQVGGWLRYCKANVVCLSETKLGEAAKGLSGSILGWNSWDQRALWAQGAAGGF